MNKKRWKDLPVRSNDYYREIVRVLRYTYLVRYANKNAEFGCFP